MSSDNTDYLTFHNAGLIAVNDLPKLYDPSLYLFPFRYLPLAAYFFTPFSLLGLELGYFFYQIFNFFLNFVIIYLIYRIFLFYRNQNLDSTKHIDSYNLKYIFSEPENKSLLHHGSIYLLMLPQFMNYFLGQINVIVLILILTSFLFLLKGGNRNDFLGGLMLGLGILFKPTLALIIPFIIPIGFDKLHRKLTLQFKKMILRLSGPVILVLFSGLIFLFYPQMLNDFIDVNLAGDYIYTTGSDLEINPSFSLTRIILILFEVIGLSFNRLLIMLLVTLIILIPLFILFIFSSNQSNKLMIGFLSGISVMLLVYFDSWPHHLVVLAPFMILFILLNKNFKRLKLFKYVYYLLTNLSLAFWGIYFLFS
ncbi:MAG: glycosyltransferase 87 family protein [Promethearchaeota archaeon]